MKDKILKLSKRLKNFSLSEISVILEAEENVIKPILGELLMDGKLILNGTNYSYNKKIASKGAISELPLFFHFHSPEVIDLILKGFCEDIPVNKLANLLSTGRIPINKFYSYFRQIIYNKQKSELEQYFKEAPRIGRERSWFGTTVFLYIYINKLFVSDKVLKSTQCIAYKETERLEIKKQYLRSFRKVQNNNYKHNFHLHIAEEIWKYNKDFQKRYELLKVLINC